MGTCCFVLPLKLGVGIVCMFFFLQSVLCILALVTGDIRFQGNGYNLHTYRLPSTVGAMGIVFGFVGLLGVYNDAVSSVRAFNRFVLLKLAAMVVTMAADYWELRKCDSWLETPEYLQGERFDVETFPALRQYYGTKNPAMDGLAREHVCPWARWAYLIGFSIDFTICAYFALKCLQLERRLQLPDWHNIDFGKDRDVKNHWLLYGVKDPRRESLLKRSADKIEEDAQKLEKARADYGSLANVQQPYQASDRYGPDGLDGPRLPLPPPPPREEWLRAPSPFPLSAGPSPSAAGHVASAVALPLVVGAAVSAPIVALPQEAPSPLSPSPREVPLGEVVAS